MTKTAYIVIAIVAALLAVAGLSVNTEDHIYINVSGPVIIEIHLSGEIQREDYVESI